LSFEVNGQF